MQRVLSLTAGKPTTAPGQELPVAGPAELPFNPRLNFESCHTADTNSSALIGTEQLQAART
jgi:hypothetical protein